MPLRAPLVAPVDEPRARPSLYLYFGRRGQARTADRRNAPTLTAADDPFAPSPRAPFRLNTLASVGIGIFSAGYSLSLIAGAVFSTVSAADQCLDDGATTKLFLPVLGALSFDDGYARNSQCTSSTGEPWIARGANIDLALQLGGLALIGIGVVTALLEGNTASAPPLRAAVTPYVRPDHMGIALSAPLLF